MGVHFFGKHVTITDLKIVTPVTANKMDVQMIRSIIQMLVYLFKVDILCKAGQTQTNCSKL